MIFRPVSFKEQKVLLFGSILLMVYIILSYLMVVYDVLQYARPLIYIASVLLFPVLLLLLNHHLETVSKEKISSMSAWILMAALFALGALSLDFPPYSVDYVWNVLSCFVSFLFFLWVFKKKAGFLEDTSSSAWFKGVLYLLVALVPFLVVLNLCFGIFFRDFFNLSQQLYVAGIRTHLIIPVIFLTLVGLFIHTFFFEKRKPLSFFKKYTFIFCFSPILLFDVVNTFDVEHYNAYLAPAIAVLNGQIPLVDVFCHYGLSYLVFTFAFLFLPNNYAVAGAILSVLNICQFVFCLLILRQLIKNPSYFLVVGVSVLFGTYYLLVESPTLVPSSLAMRYLPSVILLYFLLSRLESNDASKLNIPHFSFISFVFAFNALWSLEALIFSLGIFSAYYWLICDGWRDFFSKVCNLFLWVFITYGLLGVIYLAFFHTLPHYFTYLRYIYYYLNPNTEIGKTFLMLEYVRGFQFFFWLPVAILHVLGLFLLLYYKFGKFKCSHELKGILLVNVAAVLFFIYFVLQPSVFSFLTSSIMSIIFCVSLVVFVKENCSGGAINFCASASLVLFNATLILIVVCSVSDEPISSSVSGSLLNSFFSDNKALKENFLYNVSNFCTKKNIDASNRDFISVTENSCERYSFHDEMHHMIEKWYPDKREVLLFHRSLVEVLMEHHKIHKFLVNPSSDGLVPDFRENILRKVKRSVHVGDVIIVDKNMNVTSFEYDILHALSNIFDFKKVDVSEHLMVFVLNNKLGNGEFIFSEIPVFSESSMVYNGDAAFFTKKMLDQDKGTVWVNAQYVRFEHDVFWILFDFGKIYSVDELRLWRRIDFRIPGFYTDVNLGFIKKFNIQFSQDGKKWTLVASENNYRLNGRDFYSLTRFKDNKMRYVRINVVPDSNADEYISQIEVFGKPIKEGI